MIAIIMSNFVCQTCNYSLKNRNNLKRQNNGNYIEPLYLLWNSKSSWTARHTVCNIYKNLIKYSGYTIYTHHCLQCNLLRSLILDNFVVKLCMCIAMWSMIIHVLLWRDIVTNVLVEKEYVFCTLKLLKLNWNLLVVKVSFKASVQFRHLFWFFT